MFVLYEIVTLSRMDLESEQSQPTLGNQREGQPECIHPHWLQPFLQGPKNNGMPSLCENRQSLK